MENDPSNTDKSPIPSQRRQVPEIYKFSPDELRVLRQCNVESFYQRSLPIGTILGLGAYYLVKSGQCFKQLVLAASCACLRNLPCGLDFTVRYLKGNARFGATPKVCVSVIAGYFIGKLSYQQKCAEKLMALPNSHIGEILRQRKKHGISEGISLDPGFTSPLGIESNTPVQAPQQSYLDLDSDRPSYDYDQPMQEVSESSYDVSAIPVPPAGAPSTSYEELRRRNREEYEAQQRNRVTRLPSDGDNADGPNVIRARAPIEPREPKPKNKYGDDWE